MEKTAQYKIIGQLNIPVDKLIPHPEAVSPIEDCDRLAIQNSIAENQNTVYLPLIVSHVPDPKTGKHFIYDGVNRWKGAVAAGKKVVLCDLAETNDPKRMIGEITLNRRKHTTGTRVGTYLKMHEKEVLEARKIYGDAPKNLRKGQCFSAGHVTGGDLESFTAEAIAERLGCSDKDVRRNIKLLWAIATKTDVETGKPATTKYVKDLELVFDRVRSGATPVRTCLAAAAGIKNKGAGGRGKIEFGRSVCRACTSLVNGFSRWDTFSPDEQNFIANIWPKVEALKPKEL